MRPAIGLHLGVAVNATEIRVERLAANERTASRPDVDNVLPMGERCHCGFGIADKLESSIATGAIAARIRRHGLPARVSDDAGRYVCNSTYFAALEIAERLDPRPLTLFVHLPMPGKPRSVGGMTWQLDDLVLATRVVLLALTDQLTGRITGPIA